MRLIKGCSLFILLGIIILVSSSISFPKKAEAASNLSDAEFFGVWNGSSWTTSGKLDYAYNGGVLSAVEAKVKANDYAGAKEDLLTYFQNRTTRTAPPLVSGNKKLADLAMNLTFTGPAADYLEDEITVTDTFATVSADVLKSVSGNLGEMRLNTVGYMIIGKHKESSIAEFYSRDNGNIANRDSNAIADADYQYRPNLEVEIGGVTYSLEASKDTYIVGDSPTNYGSSTSLLVRASGIPYDSDEYRTYLTFDLSSLPKTVVPTSATLKLHGKNQSVGAKELYVFYSGNTAFNETEMNWTNTLGSIYSWQGASGGSTWDQPNYADIEYVNVLTRFTFAMPMAYEFSLDPTETYYSGGLIDRMTDFITDKVAGYPRTLETGQRATYWVRSYEQVKKSSAMTAEDNAEIIKFLWQDANFLVAPAHFSRTSNWGVIESSGLYTSAVYFPEFKSAQAWKSVAETRLQYMLSHNIYSDFSFGEASTAYASWVLDLYSSSIRFGQVNGQSFSPVFQDTLKNFAYFVMNSTAPDGSDVVYGDSDVTNNRNLINSIGSLINDNELQYFGSGGTSGALPSYTSAFYPVGKLAMMRSGWNNNDLFMHFNNGQATIHGHRDLLSTAMYAYDKQLLINPGRYNYSGDTISAWLRSSTESRNTIEIDNGAMNRNATVKTVSKWETTPGFDFTEASHNGYSGFTTTRSILFVKPSYWIVSDTVNPTSGSHSYEQLWHFLPNANLNLDSATGKVTTAFHSGANLQVVPADPTSLTPNLRDGYFSPAYGVVTTAKYSAFAQNNITGPVSFDTVLYPTVEGDNRDVTVTRLTTTPSVTATTATALKIDTENGGSGDLGYYYLSKEASPTTARRFEAYTFDGKMAYVQTSKVGNLREIDIVDGKTLKSHSTNLINASYSIPRMNVRWDGTTLYINGEGLRASQSITNGISVFAPATTQVILNGVSVSFTRDGNNIYAAELDAIVEAALVEAPRTAASSSSFHPNWQPTNAKDGNAASAWSSVQQPSSDGSEWLSVDMGANYNIKKVKLLPRSINGAPYGFPLDFKLQYSTDAATWADIPGQVFTLYPAPGNSNGEEFVFDSPVNARYIRVIGTKFSSDAAGAFYMQIAEIYPFYQTTRAARHQVTTSSTLSSVFATSNLKDDNGATPWSSTLQAGATANEWISVDMGGAFDVSKVLLVPRSANGVTYCFPVDFKLQQSVDGVTWTDIPGQSYTNYAKPTQTTGELFAFSSPVNTRHIRVLATKLRADQYNSYYMQMAEINLLGNP
jgi:hypothetical protein